MHSTAHLLSRVHFPPLLRNPSLDTLQVNLGYLCNQSCVHCHVNAGPNRTELMDEETVHKVIAVLKKRGVKTLDLTGGAPEMNPHFRYLVTQARALGVGVVDRCNLTILEYPGYEWLADFLAEHEVEVVASLPCYQVDNVDKQRGKGVFDASIRGLQRLNALGYGERLSLNLVYNPQSAVLPPPQARLEEDYKASLGEAFGIRFNQLFTLANMPIARFGSTLYSKGMFESYMQVLRQAHRTENLDKVMCKSLVSVDWRGHLYDCDFNQQLGWGIVGPKRKRLSLDDLLEEGLGERPIVVGEHCFGCTAGQGSSCGGSLV